MLDQQKGNRQDNLMPEERGDQVNYGIVFGSLSSTLKKTLHGEGWHAYYNGCR